MPDPVVSALEIVQFILTAFPVSPFIGTVLRHSEHTTSKWWAKFQTSACGHHSAPWTSILTAKRHLTTLDVCWLELRFVGRWIASMKSDVVLLVLAGCSQSELICTLIWQCLELLLVFKAGGYCWLLVGRGQHCCCCCSSLSYVWLFVTPWTVARQGLLSVELPKQESWSELPFPTLEDLPDLGSNPCLLHYRQILCHWSPGVWSNCLLSHVPLHSCLWMFILYVHFTNVLLIFYCEVPPSPLGSRKSVNKDKQTDFQRNLQARAQHLAWNKTLWGHYFGKGDPVAQLYISRHFQGWYFRACNPRKVFEGGESGWPRTCCCNEKCWKREKPVTWCQS